MEEGEERVNGKLALVYDFDGTLIDGEMFDPLLADLGLDAEAFWDESNRFAQQHRMDRICCYMLLLLREAARRERKLTRDVMRDVGRGLEMRAGLADEPGWFDAVDAACAEHGLEPEHYVVTSGLAEIVEASPVRERFKKVFGSRYHYDEDGAAAWPAQMVNYTTKTQYLFRISKGALDESDEQAPNRYMDAADRPVPFGRMVFIGDGLTDIPCFSLVKKHQGTAVAVRYAKTEDAMQRLEQLLADGRVDLVSMTAHFEEGGKLLESIRRVIKRKAREAEQQRHLQAVQ